MFVLFLPKVSLNIGIARNHDQLWIKQFNSLFIILNENNEVVSWQLTKREQFDVVKDLLESVKIRLRLMGASVQYFVIDNCCKWKEKLKNVFGNELSIKLDLFHAVQRITTSMDKRHPLYNSCVSELKIVFRQQNDHGPTRTLYTPESEVLLQHITNFAAKWRHICEKDGSNESLFREEFENRLKDLKDHIKNGCLPDIPPGYSTSLNGVQVALNTDK